MNQSDSLEINEFQEDMESSILSVVIEGA